MCGLTSVLKYCAEPGVGLSAAAMLSGYDKARSGSSCVPDVDLQILPFSRMMPR